MSIGMKDYIFLFRLQQEKAMIDLQNVTEIIKEMVYKNVKGITANLQ